MKVRLVTAVALIALAGAARAEDPPVPAPSPTPAATAKPADAAKPADDAGPRLGLWLGSKQDGENGQAGFELFFADFKDHSHFGFREHVGRTFEPSFVKDLGWPKTVLIEGVSLRFDLAQFGWLGADVTGYSVSNQTGTVEQQRELSGVSLNPGDTLHSHGYVLWTKLYYGYDFGYRFKPLGGVVPCEAAISPYVGMQDIELDVRVRRAAPTPTNDLGGHIEGWGFFPGLRGYVDFFDHVKLGGDMGVPGAFSTQNPRIRTSDRYAIFLGLHAFNVEIDVGWKMVGNHLLALDRAVDMRYRNLDVQLRVTF
jgi:hypothetical protein